MRSSTSTGTLACGAKTSRVACPAVVVCRGGCSEDSSGSRDTRTRAGMRLRAYSPE